MKELMEFIMTVIGFFVLVIFLFLGFNIIRNGEVILIAEQDLELNIPQVKISGDGTEFYCRPTDKGLEYLKKKKELNELYKNNKKGE